MSTHIQLWPSGKSVEFFTGGDGDLYIEEKTGCRLATDEERRLIKIEQLAQLYSDREIYCCDSSLVTDAMRFAYEDRNDFAKEWEMENIVNLQADPSEWTIEECKEWLEDNDEELPDPNPWGMTREELLDHAYSREACEKMDNVADVLADVLDDINLEVADGLKEWREAVQDKAYEHEQEVYEWWRVSPWLASKLKAYGYPVLDNNYGEWWGRCCTGQSYMMDGTLQRVAAQFV